MCVCLLCNGQGPTHMSLSPHVVKWKKKKGSQKERDPGSDVNRYECRGGGDGSGVAVGGAILVRVLSWKLQPHYKWRHPEKAWIAKQMMCVKARREATPRLCDNVPSQLKPSLFYTHTQTHTHA